MNELINSKSVGVKNGIVLGLILVIYTLILQLAGVAGNQSLGYVSYIFIIGMMILGNKQLKEAQDGFMSFGEGFKTGMWISLISGVLNSMFLYIYLSFIDDSMFDLVREQSIAQFEARGMTEEQIDQALAMTDSFMTPEMMFGMGVLGAVVGGLILSAIISAVMKKDKPVFE